MLPVIVAGVDGSPGARAALSFAIGEARLRGAAVTAICAYERPWTEAAGPPGRPDSLAVARAILRTEVAEALEVIGGGVRVEQQAVEGPAAKSLLAAAASAELLVVGSRGRRGFRGLLLGSVSQQCACHAPCPVVIVPPAVAAEGVAFPTFAEGLARGSSLRVVRLPAARGWYVDVLAPDGHRLGSSVSFDRETAVELAVAEAAHLSALEGGYHPEREWTEHGRA
jgi:nucleotide-binding universal stress UspA family protein